jgi:signal transduction histidine kinase
VPAINDLINRAQSEETPKIEFQYFDVNGQLDPTASLNIYRIVQELINNSIKHANASEILVQLLQKDDELMITVEDDGIGFDTEKVKTGMGTGNIASRVNFLKGEISVHTRPGEGTSTLVTIPVA